MKAEWLAQVADAVAAAAKQPQFPGDPSVVLPLLEKLVQRLYGECFNDGPVGADDCPVCRSYRTEAAEAASVTAKKAAAKLEKALAAEAAARSAADDVAANLAGQLDQATQELLSARADEGAAIARAQDARQAYVDAVAERAVADSNCAAAQGQLLGVTNKLEMVRTKYLKLYNAIQENM